MSALVVTPRDRCPSCSLPLREISWAQLPLVRHGGFGAALVTVLALCRCGWSIVRSVSEARP